jgi:uncharacterized MnhB-related membrane protein
VLWRLDIILLLFLVATALGVYVTKDLMAASIIFSAYSLTMAIVWQQLSAPDLALTEAAVGAGVTTVLFLITISKTVRRED